MSRRMAMGALLGWSFLFFVAIVFAFQGAAEFLEWHKQHKKEVAASTTKDAAKVDSSHKADSVDLDAGKGHGGLSNWDHAYGALLLLHAHPLEGVAEAPRDPLFARVRVVLPFLWEFVFAGFLAGVVVFRRRILNFIRFAVHPPRVVVFGWSPMARAIAQAANARRDRVVMVVEHPDKAAHSFCDAQGIPLVIDALEHRCRGGHNFRLSVTLRLPWARQIVFADADDGQNIEHALAVADLVEHPCKMAGIGLLVRAWRSLLRSIFRRQAAWSGLRHAQVGDLVLLRDLESSGLLEHHGTIPCNWDEFRARHAMEQIEPLRERVLRSPSLGGNTDSASSALPCFEPVHLYVFGDGSLASAVVLEFLKAGQWSEELHPRVTLISKGAEAHLRLLKGQYANLELCSSIDAWNTDLPSPELRERLERVSEQTHSRPVFLVADPDSKKAVSAGLWLSRISGCEAASILLPSGSDDGVFHVLASLQNELGQARREFEGFQKRSSALESGNDSARLLLKSKKDQLEKLREAFHFSERISVFGDPGSAGGFLIEDGFHDEDLARFREGAEIFHETYCGSKDSWKTLHPAFRISSRSAFRHVRHKLSAIGNPEPASATVVLESNMEALARLEHLRWNAERWLAGWRLGETKSERNRISPYLVPWEKLDEPTREYDRISVRTIESVRSILARKAGGGKS